MKTNRVYFFVHPLVLDRKKSPQVREDKRGFDDQTFSVWVFLHNKC